MQTRDQEKYRILFVCVHNSARSQMAEAFLREFGGNRYHAESAGLEPGKINPVVVEVMQEVGIDLSRKETRDVQSVFLAGARFDAVITVCDAAHSEKCPVFPGVKKRIQWFFDDPSSFRGTRQEILERTRMVRDQVEKRVREWIRQTREPGFWDPGDPEGNISGQ